MPLALVAFSGAILAGAIWFVRRDAAWQATGSATATPDAPTLATASDASLRRAPFPGPYPARLVRVVDGDTFEARVRVWFGQEVATLIRIRGIDAPELRGRCDQEARRAAQAKDLLEDFLSSGVVVLRDVSADKYFGRVVATVEVAAESGSGDDVAGLMVAANLARPYDGRQRASWCVAADATH